MQATSLQHQASDPTASVWVSANAGSGKTHVLVQRIIRLLLQGIPPNKILALTYTKAAAANMATRVFDTLAQWVGFDDPTLKNTLEALGVHTPTTATLIQARQLFARAVETPGGLKIQTIHAFCERLLHLFPFEANIAAQFKVLDSVQINALIKQAQTNLLTHILHDDKSPLAKALFDVAELRSEATLTDLLNEAWAVIRKMRLSVGAAETPEQLTAALAQALGISPDAQRTEVDADICTQALSSDDLKKLSALFAQGGKIENKTVPKIEQVLSLRQAGKDWLSAYLDIFCKKDGMPYQLSYLVRKATSEAYPDLIALFAQELDRLAICLHRLALIRTLTISRALFYLGFAVGADYDQAKTRTGSLDFEDLIERTLSLLRRSDARWVLFKLDQGIDHLLVDEAQDTSPAQWDILKAITDDFFSGQGSTTLKRTIFAVGDPKQSIYSFQGAAPDSFSQSAHFFERQIKALPTEQGGRFSSVKLQLSFRSSETILRAVDAIFQKDAHHHGLEHPPQAPAHEARRADLPGHVEIWPLIEAQKDEETEEWVPALKDYSTPLPSVLLAQKIAQKIAALCHPSSPERIHELNYAQEVVARPIRPGDILILVRKRSAFFDAVIRALKDHAIPVAGADRLSLLDHIAIQDLIALGQACLCTADDLALACVLKSPLFQLTDDDLLTLAPTRSASLYEALSHHSAYQTIITRLNLFRQWAHLYGPFGFYARVLDQGLGREALLGRLGLETADPLDAFLQAAQDFEYNKTPSLSLFLNNFIEAQTEIKRDMEAGRDEVRVMTVHGAKGLEAPIVFLPDTTSVPDKKLLSPFPTLATANGVIPAWSLNEKSNPPLVNQAMDDMLARQLDEYRRLLYVALTRARERLYIAGFKGAHALKDDCWYGVIRSGLGTLATPEDPDQPEHCIWRYSTQTLRSYDDQEGVTPFVAPTASPAWLRQAARQEGPARAPLTPSHASSAADHTERQRETPWQRKAQQRGTLLHRLLELLPPLAPDLRPTAAANLIKARGQFLTTEEQSTLWQDCARLLSDPACADLFAPHAQAEVRITGTVACGPNHDLIPVTGQIDRLVVLETHILLCDFKTTAYAPTSLAEIDHAHLTQMALYVALLKKLYPARPIKACLLYTASATMLDLPDGVMEQQLLELRL